MKSFKHKTGLKFFSRCFRKEKHILMYSCLLNLEVQTLSRIKNAKILNIKLTISENEFLVDIFEEKSRL